MDKKTIGRFFILVGFIGGAFGGYLSLNVSAYITYAYFLIYVGHLFAWKFLFDYTKRLEETK